MHPRKLVSALLFAVGCTACGGNGSNESGDSSGSGTTEPPPSRAESCVENPEPVTPIMQMVKFEASDGAQLHAIVRGVPDAGNELCARPVIIEFSPYGGNGIPDFGPAYNHVFVHARGTGNSTGVWSAVGPRDQQDVAEFLEWACAQAWSNGHIGLYGFSASAIAVYNSMQLPLACVDAAVLMAGTNNLYRDLLYPGGIPNIVPELVVGVGVGLPLLLSNPQRFQEGQPFTDPLQAGLGLQLLAAEIFQHPTEDQFWLERTQRPGPNSFPVLANTGFYDVESRGPFESYKMLRDLGVPVHLRVFGAHDGFPAGTPGPFPEYRRWFDRYLRGIDNGIEREPRVQFLLGHGGFEAQLLGAVTKMEATDWPLPGTRWQPLYLDGTRGGGALSINDGKLSTTPVEAAQTPQAYPALGSITLATDPHTSATVTNGGAPAFAAFPFLTWQLLLAEPSSLTYTTPEFTQDVDVVGPASLDVFLATALPEADLYAVVADVWPDGFAHAVGIGRVRTSFPNIVAGRSVTDANGETVHPYPDHSEKTPATPGEVREYRVEFWPLGNRFEAGHRLRLYLVGAPFSMLVAPSVNIVSLGGGTPSRLLLPVLPGNDLHAALPQAD